MQTPQAYMQTCEKGGANLRNFIKKGANLKFDFEAKIRGVNSVSGEKLHDFEIICPASANALPAHPLHTGLHPLNNKWTHTMDKDGRVH